MGPSTGAGGYAALRRSAPGPSWPERPERPASRLSKRSSDSGGGPAGGEVQWRLGLMTGLSTEAMMRMSSRPDRELFAAFRPQQLPTARSAPVGGSDFTLSWSLNL